MAKIAILKVGYAQFVLPPKVKAGALLDALSQAEAVEYTFQGHQTVYYPAEGRSREISLEYIDAKQLLPRKPRTDDDGQDVNDLPVRAPRALMPAKPLTLMGGSDDAARR